MPSKRPGRPPLDPVHTSTRITVRVSPKQYDDAHERADDARISISEWVRRTLGRAIDDKGK